MAVQAENGRGCHPRGGHTQTSPVSSGPSTPTSSGPDAAKLLNLGPQYIRNRYLKREPGIERRNRRSAVELLEESKSLYVKSERVLDSKQVLKSADILQVGQRRSTYGLSTGGATEAETTGGGGGGGVGERQLGLGSTSDTSSPAAASIVTVQESSGETSLDAVGSSAEQLQEQQQQQKPQQQSVTEAVAPVSEDSAALVTAAAVSLLGLAPSGGVDEKEVSGRSTNRLRNQSHSAPGPGSPTAPQHCPSTPFLSTGQTATASAATRVSAVADVGGVSVVEDQVDAGRRQRSAGSTACRYCSLASRPCDECLPREGSTGSGASVGGVPDGGSSGGGSSQPTAGERVGRGESGRNASTSDSAPQTLPRPPPPVPPKPSESSYQTFQQQQQQAQQPTAQQGSDCPRQPPPVPPKRHSFLVSDAVLSGNPGLGVAASPKAAVPPPVPPKPGDRSSVHVDRPGPPIVPPKPSAASPALQQLRRTTYNGMEGNASSAPAVPAARPKSSVDSTRSSGSTPPPVPPKPKPTLLASDAWREAHTDTSSEIDQHSTSSLVKVDDKLVVVRRRPRKFHRSRSDLTKRFSNSSDLSELSARFSRNSADLEKFFNEMGLDRSVLEPMMLSACQRSASDLHLFESASSLESPDVRSWCSDDDTDHPLKHEAVEERTPPGGQASIVERNARIIKWLCSVKKAASHEEPLTEQ